MFKVLNTLTMFSVVVMQQQTEIYANEKGVFLQKQRLSTAIISESNYGNEETLRNRNEYLKKKVEELSRRVEELEKAKFDLLYLINDSFDTTVSVNSQDLIEVPKDIWKNWVRIVVVEWFQPFFRHRKIKLEAFILMFKVLNTLTLYNICCCFSSFS